LSWLGLAIEALSGEAPARNALRDSSSLQFAIDVALPSLSPTDQERSVVPIAHLGPKSIRLKRSHREENVRVMVARVTTLMRAVDRDIGYHPARDELLAHEAADELQPARVVELVREREQNLAAELRVFPALSVFDAIP